MKKVIALILTAIFLTLPLTVSVLAGWEEEANIGNVKLEFKGYADKPVIDGKLDEFGYSQVTPGAGDMSYAYNDTTEGADAWAKDLKFDFYASYDADYVYLFVSMDANHYYNDCDEDTAGNIWGQSAIQANFAQVGDEGTQRLEYGIGRNSVDGTLISTVWAQYEGASAELAPVAGEDYAIVLDGGKLNYELRTPVNTFTNGKTLKVGDQITFCMVMAQCDQENGADQGTGGYIHTQIASGCTGNGKTAENFAIVTLAAPIEKPAAPAETEAPADVPAATDAPAVVVTTSPVAPTTGDSTLVFCVIMVIAAAGVVVFKKRIFVK